MENHCTSNLHNKMQILNQTTWSLGWRSCSSASQSPLTRCLNKTRGFIHIHHNGGSLSPFRELSQADFPWCFTKPKWEHIHSMFKGLKRAAVPSLQSFCWSFWTTHIDLNLFTLHLRHLKWLFSSFPLHVDCNFTRFL